MLKFRPETVSGQKPVLGMILKGFPRISETFISNEILLLEQLGFSIRIFSMRHPRENFTHKSVRRIRAKTDYLPQSILEGLPQFLYHNFCLAVKNPGRYGSALKTAFRRFCRTRKSATIKHLLQAGYLLHKLLPENSSPDEKVIHFHAHFAHSPTSVAMFASRLSGIPFSFTAHAKDIYTSDPRQLKEKAALARFVVTCTEYNRRYLLSLLQSAAKPVYRVYHGIDIRLFQTADRSAKPEPPWQILTIARLVPKKGLPAVYAALRILRDRGFLFEHTLIGDGEEREKILKIIRESKLDDICRWKGTLPHEKVLEYFRKSDLFVIGCRIAENGDRDGIPNVLTESMAMGVPVVATSVSALPELVRQGKTGLLVPPENPPKMARAIERLLTDISLRKEIIANAKQLVGKEHDNHKLIRELAAVYQKEIY
ncbi:MAG: glycosyltransferase family 4 protein [Desulfococcaceae bacterium]|jgi:glycosyltransferase involved in cell wall biosynthesis|nr:glycosyltransferase family 4 protein [Desulfococcaceae bacterium]